MNKYLFLDEELLKLAFQSDIWFHVDDLSSAHVYLRMRPEWTIDSIPKDLVTDCCQLVKYNSIEGNKLNNVKIVYTHLSNIKKEAGFDVGQVTFKDGKKVTIRRIYLISSSILRPSLLLFRENLQ